MSKSEIEFIAASRRQYKELVGGSNSECIATNQISGCPIRVPKVIAKVKLCGALTFEINDTMQFEMPTKEQCENLKKTFGIEVELVDEVDI